MGLHYESFPDRHLDAWKVGEAAKAEAPDWTASYITGRMRANDSFSLWKRLETAAMM